MIFAEIEFVNSIESIRHIIGSKTKINESDQLTPPIGVRLVQKGLSRLTPTFSRRKFFGQNLAFGREKKAQLAKRDVVYLVRREFFLGMHLDCFAQQQFFQVHSEQKINRHY